MNVKRRLILITVLWLLPLLFLASVGGYAIWERGWSFWVWWPMALCWGGSMFLAWKWGTGDNRLLPIDTTTPLAWTARDHEAWKSIEARIANADKLTTAQLTEPTTYINTAEEVAQSLARVYYPKASDPWSHLTLPEILAVIELATHDLGERLREYVPGSHLVTVRNLLQARQAVDLYDKATNAYWAIAALFSPVKTSIRYAASKAGLSQPSAWIQKSVLSWLYVLYLQRLGHYLIECYSGRLRIGVDRYREIVKHQEGSQRVVITILGQVKAGKSSLINALLRERKATVDQLPATDAITAYRCGLEGTECELILQDTVGYGHEGPKRDAIRKTMAAAQDSDVLLLVMHARNPARQADAMAMEQLAEWFQEHPQRKKPPIIGVLSHIDLLTPAMEWSPPYNWREPKGLKETNIAAAVAAASESMGKGIEEYVPVCTADGRITGLVEDLGPAILKRLPESRAVALLRVLHAESDEGKMRRVLEQVLALGKAVVRR